MNEQKQYAATLAATGAWRGTNWQRLYNELGWESFTVQDGTAIYITFLTGKIENQ